MPFHNKNISIKEFLSKMSILPKHGPIRLLYGTLKTTFIVIVFILGALSIVFTQIVGTLISFNDQTFLHAWLSNTKSSFIVLLTSVVTFVSTSPINFRIIAKGLPETTFKQDPITHRLRSTIASNSVIIGNHQIYIEWAFFWWFAYTSDLSGFFYIMLKDSLKNIPILGFGMRNYDFIFLSRKWATDKKTLDEHLERIDANGRGYGPASGVTRMEGTDAWPEGVRKDKVWPYNILLFPEGTNLSNNTRSKTEIYAKKVGKKPFKNILLPKTTGMRYTLLKLRKSVKEIYDITVGYSGVKQDEYGQDIYSLKRIFLEGLNPEQVEFYVRSYKIEDIPIGELNYEDPEEEKEAIKKFEDWLFGVWQEKDELLDVFYANGSFVNKEDESSKDLNIIDTQFKVGFWELLNVFKVPFIFILVIRLLYVIIKKVFYC